MNRCILFKRISGDTFAYHDADRRLRNVRTHIDLYTVCIYAYIYIYICIYMNIYIHICIYIAIYSSNDSCSCKDAFSASASLVTRSQYTLRTKGYARYAPI